MIQITVNKEGNLHVDEWCIPPTVYLDHWAWRRISESEPLAERFSSALSARGGTLALSWLNLIEFSKVTDAQQACKADALLDKILPRVFILNPNFYKVISKEDELQKGGKPVAPHADIDTLKFFAIHNISKPNSLKFFPAQNLFSLTLASATATGFDGLADLIVKHIDLLRQEYDANREFHRAVKRIPKNQPIQCGTRLIARELLGSFLINKQVKPDRNHAIDVSHAVVPAAYCDYVLLDGHWAEQVERARKRIRDGGMSFPIAKVFSERENGLERFLQELESGHGNTNP